MYRNKDLYSKGATAEDSMKFVAAFPQSRDNYEKSLYFEAARRVVFQNCMGACDLDDTKVPNFNKNFHYNMPEEKACLQECFNTRMDLHFGASNAKQNNLHMDFNQMKWEFQNYERWQPNNRVASMYSQGYEEDSVKATLSSLHAKTQAAKSKYDF